MKFVVLVSPHPFDVAALGQKAAVDGRVHVSDKGHLHFQGDAGWFAIRPDARIIDEFEEAHLQRVRDRVETPEFALLEFGSADAARRALEILSEDSSIWIDNDHGIFAPVVDFLERSSSDPEWYYARPLRAPT
jgi:hypothetical protein